MAFFRSFDLPKEVRDLVYAEYAKDFVPREACELFNAQYTQDFELEFNCRYVRTRSWTFSFQETSTHDHDGDSDEVSDSEEEVHPAAVLSTCRQFRNEMLECMAAHITLRIKDIQKMLWPAQMISGCVPSEVCQHLRSIALDVSDEQLDGGHRSCRFDPSAEYGPFAEWLREVFPRLEHVTIRDSPSFQREDQLVTAPKQRLDEHKAYYGSEMPQLSSSVKDVFKGYQSKDLRLELYLRYCLQDAGCVWEDWIHTAPKEADDLLFAHVDGGTLEEVPDEKGDPWWGYY